MEYKLNYIKTNIKKFDDCVGGLIPGKINMICGVACSGKTLLSSEIISNIDVDVNHYLIEDKEPKYVKMSKLNYSFAHTESIRIIFDVIDYQITNGFSGLIVIDDLNWDYKEVKPCLLSLLRAIKDKDITLLVTYRQRDEENCNPNSLFTIADLIVSTELSKPNKESKIKVKNLKNRYKISYEDFELSV